MRNSPYQSLGSEKQNGKVLGGDVMSKDAASKLRDDELLECIAKLPAYLKNSLPPKPAADDRTDAQWLVDHGWIPVEPNAERLAMETDRRGAFMQALAFGMQSNSARKFFSPNIVKEVFMALEGSAIFSSRKSAIMAPRRGAAWKKPSDNPPAVGGCGREAQEEREPQGIGG